MTTALSQGVPLSAYLLLSAILFALGVIGFLIKRNLITVSCPLNLCQRRESLLCHFRLPVARSQRTDFVFFVMVVAAAEAASDLPSSSRLPRAPRWPSIALT